MGPPTYHSVTFNIVGFLLSVVVGAPDVEGAREVVHGVDADSLVAEVEVAAVTAVWVVVLEDGVLIQALGRYGVYTEDPLLPAMFADVVTDAVVAVFFP